MVSKTKTKTRKKGKPTKGSKKSKTNLKKRSGVKKPRIKRTKAIVARPKKVSSKRKKTTITTPPTTNTTSPSEHEETSLLTEENTSSLDDVAVSGTGESEPGISERISDEEIASSYTSITEPAEDQYVKDNGRTSETV